MVTRTRYLLLLALGLLLLPAGAEADAYFAPFGKMVREADAILLVELVSSRPERPAEADRVCKDTIATVKVERVVAGGRERIGEIRIPCFFPCAIVQSPPGRYLVFLKLREGVPTNSNWHLSLLPISRGQLRWYGDENSSHDSLSLGRAIRHIRRARARR